MLGRLRDDISRPLAPILSLNTVANTTDAAGVGAEATRLFGSACLVTLEDVVETLLELEIVDEADRDRDMRELAHGQWEKRRAGAGARRC